MLTILIRGLEVKMAARVTFSIYGDESPIILAMVDKDSYTK